MIQVKYFTLGEYSQEEDWLENMAEKGWFLRKSIIPCVYIFDKGQPRKMVYRFDYFDSRDQQQDCINLYEQYGWKFIPSMNGFVLFCKPAADTRPEDLEIFNTLESRQEMITRIIKARLLPLTFCLLVMAVLAGMQLSRYFNNHQTGLDNVLISVGCLMIVGYLVISCWIALSRQKKSGVKHSAS